MNEFQISGNIILIEENKIKGGKVFVKNGCINNIEFDNKNYDTYILPGFVDSHIHIESSMLVPKEFGRIAPIHGTVASISDPHEIGNVLGVDGVQYMIDNGKESPFKFHFGAPSCVPATSFETAGDEITPEQIDELMQSDDIYYLAEMMNYPGVLFEDKDILKKIASAKKYNKPVDGHAPGLRGDDAKKYISAGISTDHECFSKAEALDKLKYGMKILIREGSAAKNFEALYTLIDEYPEMVMLCSDDKHPDDLIEGHINQLVKRALDKGQNLFNILKAACINPVKHYKMDVGTLNIGDKADFIVINNTTDFAVLKTYIDGKLIAQNGKTSINYTKSEIVNKFNVDLITASDLVIEPSSEKINVIEALDGELITNKIEANVLIENNNAVSDIDNDILKMVVVNRYSNQPISKCFIKNFNLKEGAIASCVAHDSHNIIAVGCNDEVIAKAVNLVIEGKGGVSLATETEEISLELPIAGIMTDKNAYEIAELYSKLDKRSKELGSKLRAPYMTLSFMALLVIPSLKLSDKGLFDGNKFEFENIFK